jgi:hypothetical protein
MTKRSALAVFAIFVAWMILDFVLHGVVLRNTYVETAGLWRPEPDLKAMRPTMALLTLLHSALFVALYATLADRRTLARGLLFGLLFGATIGLGMGFGTWCVMPIPPFLAWAWFLGTTVEGVVAGAILGTILRARA